MDVWNKGMYGWLGLIDKVKVLIMIEVEVEVELLVFFKKWVLKSKLLMCGNFIC